MTLHLRLFGGFQLADGKGGVVRVPSRKSRALLAYLAVCPNQSCPRDRLMTILWSNCPQAQARQSLRKELSRLRRSLGDDGVHGICTQADLVWLRPEFLATDVDRFRRLARSFALAELEGARDLYGGFLDGFHIDEDLFEEWLEDQRRGFVQEAVALLTRLAELYTECNAPSAAIEALRHALRLDAWRDDVLRSLLGLMAVAGRHTDMKVAYDQHVTQLRAELATGPDEETVLLYRQLCGGKTRPVGRRPVGRNLPAADPGATAVALRPFVDRTGQQACAVATSDVMVELARFRDLTIVPCDGGAATLPAAAARYLVEGEIRGRGRKQTCLVILRETVSGQLKWAERVDGPVGGALDETRLLARRIAARLAPAVVQAELNRVVQKHESLLQPAELAKRAKLDIGIGIKSGIAARLLRGLELAERAAEMDEGCAEAMAALSLACSYRDLMRWSGGRDLAKAARQASDRLLELEPESHGTHLRIGWRAYVAGRHAAALNSLRHANDLNPNDAGCTAALAFVETMSGLSVEAERHARAAIDLNPRHPDVALFCGTLNMALRQQGRFCEARQWGERAVSVSPNDPIVRTGLLICCSEAGFSDEAGSAYAELSHRVPAYLAALTSGDRRPYLHAGDNDRLAEALGRARHAAKRW